MADGVSDGRPMPRFFCHKCSVEIERLLPDYTCPLCTFGFIEELESNENDRSPTGDVTDQDYLNMAFLNALRYAGSRAQDVDNGTFQTGETRNVRQRRDHSEATPRPRRDQGEAILTRRTPPDSAPDFVPVNPSEQRTNESRGPIHDSHNRSRRMRHFHTRRPLRHRWLRQEMDLFFEDFMSGLTGVHLRLDQSPVFDIRVLLSNPAEYTFGRNGLDTIVTQLLNQMDTTGPPPLSRTLIDEIPTTAISQDQVDNKLQCSICWEDFIVSEPVRQLRCLHVYHAPCIVPWLELHGTCPICRQILGEHDAQETVEDTIGPSLAALFRVADESNDTTPSASPTSDGSSTGNRHDI
ncbi:E3 ubiquitin-protein ligase RNF126-A isoform X2 [Cephus cinctus]|uniref:RING-type E3 ubiquitin transferase n=1 Tax=Cephus cinctus TaxID=211228 RepID=A0AAJ7FSX4_CEPCN|nr:E3 ubiquitin-protein ligase RNF126-A isoform X2 [Cephus cinctus]